MNAFQILDVDTYIHCVLLLLMLLFLFCFVFEIQFKNEFGPEWTYCVDKAKGYLYFYISGNKINM